MKIKLLSLSLVCLCMFAGAQEENPVARRIQYRKQLSDPAQKEAAIKAGLQDKDPIIRKKAVYELFVSKGDASIPELKPICKDEDKGVMLLVLSCVKNIKNTTSRNEMAKYLADNTVIDEIKRDAKRMLTSFNFFRKNVRLKDDPAYDHDVSELASIQIPDDNWLIIKDVVEDGHEKGFFKAGLNDSKWQKIKCGAWETQCLGNFDGVAWYRIRFKAPAKEKAAVGAELLFEAVDEIAWVWLNETYIGQHDMGPAGWNIPFILDITKEIKWGEENLLVVRVHDSTAAGGIWKPITLKVLK